ncbi:xylulokinase [Agaribacterium sp. ZY112]|uniref:xylulokinase n=1 Tax=Agaribacterium sp. ZY112 TaxID=3233574 RepID=UPI003523F82E
MKTIMGVDLGTQSLKVLVYDADSKASVFSASSAYDLITRDDGSAEQDPQWWLDAFHTCLAECPADIKQSIVALGVSGQQHGFVALDKGGQVLVPAKLWCDTSTSTQAESIISDAGGRSRCRELSGNVLSVGFTASKIRWLKEAEPKKYAALDLILLPHDYLNYYLTGKACMEHGDASGTGLLDVRQRSWSRAMLDALDSERDLRPLLPELIKAEQSCGSIRPELAEQLGLNKQLIVSAGGGDNMMAAIGTGNVCEGRLSASMGTSGTLFAYSSKPVIDETDELAAFCSSDGAWLPLLCTMNCTVATEQMKQLFDCTSGDLEQLAATVAIGADGVLTLPYYGGERSPNLPHAKALIYGLNHNNTSQAHMIRSAMEAAAFALKSGLQAFERMGMHFNEVRLTGGGSKNTLWRQIVADVFALPVTVLNEEENAALGAVLQALWCFEHAQGRPIKLQTLADEHISENPSKACEPKPDAVKAYAEVYQSYQALVAHMAPLFSA